MSRRRHAFTLLEMLAAIAIMGIIVASLYASMHVSFGAYGRAKQAVDPLRTAEIAIDLIRRDLEAALPQQGILSGPLVGDPWDYQAAVRFFTTSSPPQGLGPAADINYVELALVDTGFASVLVRRIAASLPAPLPPPMHEEVLCRHVELFQLRYFNGVTWQDQWDSTAYDSLPAAVEVTLQIRPDPAREPTRVRRVVAIPASRIQPDDDDDEEEVVEPV